MVLYIPGGAGFLPSTVGLAFVHDATTIEMKNMIFWQEAAGQEVK